MQRSRRKRTKKKWQQKSTDKQKRPIDRYFLRWQDDDTPPPALCHRHHHHHHRCRLCRPCRCRHRRRWRRRRSSLEMNRKKNWSNSRKNNQWKLNPARADPLHGQHPCSIRQQTAESRRQTRSLRWTGLTWPTRRVSIKVNGRAMIATVNRNQWMNYVPQPWDLFPYAFQLNVTQMNNNVPSRQRCLCRRRCSSIPVPVVRTTTTTTTT